MNFKHSFILFIPLLISIVNSAVVVNDGDVDQQGLYNRSDGVDILTNRNFERKVYGQAHALVIQFYNSYCGHCRSFAPKFKALAGEISSWKNIVKLAVLDCSVEENNEFCREFEVMAYPSLRYVREFYLKSNGNVGNKIQIAESVEKLKGNIIHHMQEEQVGGHLRMGPSLLIKDYSSFSDAINDNPQNIIHTFLVLENVNSSIGSEIALDINDYVNIKVKRVIENGDLARNNGINNFPVVIAVSPTSDYTVLSTEGQTKQEFLKAIDTFLESKHYRFPARFIVKGDVPSDGHLDVKPTFNTELVYYSDLEKTLRTSLNTEITRHKTLSAETRQALIDYLDVILTSFPFRGNLKVFIRELLATISSKNSWTGAEVYELVKSLEATYSPYSSNNLEYVRCRGSQPQYRGYTCGLWTLFHTLTVNAPQTTGSTEGQKILKAMYGYVKHFFGCTTCQEHFKNMAERNKIFEVTLNYKAVLWLWIAHNEVNLRLAGDNTEDPNHPKIQYPSVSSCPECRLARGAWNLSAVYQYLHNVYSADNIQVARQMRSAPTASSPFSNLDIGMLSLLYMSA